MALGSLPSLLRHAAHGGQVGQQRHAGEVLQHHAGDDEGDFGRCGRRGEPVGQLPHVLGRDLLAVAVAQHRLEHDAHGHRQALELLGNLAAPLLAPHTLPEAVLKLLSVEEKAWGGGLAISASTCATGASTAA
jgi:hypothetical protein